MLEKAEFYGYLREIGLSETAVARVEEIYEWGKALCPDEITGIFVTDYVTDEARREYEHLWFFSVGHAIEARWFIARDDIDITTVRNRIEYVRLTMTDYDLRTAGPASRLVARFRIEGGQPEGEFKASGENCDFLMGVFKEYVLPHLTR